VTRQRKPCLGSEAERASSAWSRWLLPALAAALCGLGGCANFWEDVSSNDFKMDNLFHPPDPLVVLRDSTDGDQRARALRSLQEPLSHGGDQKQQDAIVAILTKSATSDDQPMCRLAAISALRRFRDVRAEPALERAYYNAGRFEAQTATVIRCQALEALGDSGNPEAIKTLVKVLREPPVDVEKSPDPDRQRKLDERMAAARALGKFPQAQAAQALVEVLRGEQDVALRFRAHESLQLATGRQLPPDPQVWTDFINQSANRPDTALAREPSVGEKFLRLTGWNKD
jgi:HEAT repeat protein